MADKKAKMSQAEQQAIIQTFQQMRNEQRTLINKIAELETELIEHKAVLTKLSEVAPDRKCFRVIGGVLVQRTVAEVAPAVTENRDKLDSLLNNLNETLVKKGKELNEYKEKHDLHVRGEKEAPSDNSTSESSSKTTQSVLAN